MIPLFRVYLVLPELIALIPASAMCVGVGFVFKGSGFYITENRSAKYKESAKNDSEPKAEKKESKKTTEKKSEPKKTDTTTKKK